MCNWEMNFGNSGMLNVKCNAPVTATSEFASLKIEFLKDMYGLNANSKLEAFDKIMKSKYVDTYCR